MLDYNSLIQDVSREFPDFEIRQKSESRLMKVIDVCLKVITFGAMRTFMTRFITTIGTTVYVPDGWGEEPPVSKIITLRHELVHMRQSRKHGALLFRMLYLAVLPTVWTYRAKFEMEAYEETIRAIVEYRGKEALTAELKSGLVRHFTSAEYFWMNPFKKSVEKWYDGVASAALAGPAE